MFKHPKCGGRHTTIAEAKTCETGGGGVATMTRPVGHAVDYEPATTAQEGFLDTLIKDRRWIDLPAGTPEKDTIQDRVTGMNISKRNASAAIKLLLTRPFKDKTVPAGTMPIPTSPAPQGAKLHYAVVADGYYAVTLPGETKLRFFRVKTPRNPRPGSTFVYVDEQAGSTRYPVKPGPRKAAILAAIAEDEDKAGKRYAAELGNCYRCNRELTDEDSRARGIGPVCATKN